METTWKDLLFLLPFVSGFLVGSFPTGYLLVKARTGKDIRALGSGNAGATNVFRSVGRLDGLAVLLADFFKGAFAVVLLSRIFHFPFTSFETYQFLIGLFTILGHVFTPFLGFKGGKGVATAGGVALAIYPFHFSMAFIGWLAVLAATRYMSLASITGAWVFAVLAVLSFHNRFHILLALLCATFITWTHRANVRRLLKGEELKLKFKR